MLGKVAVVIAVALGGTGCATIVQGPVQRVWFDTEPRGAVVRAEMQACTTPCSLPLMRNHNIEAQILKDGYAPESVLVRYELHPWILGNIVFLPFAPIAGAIDIVSGAGFQLYPAVVNLPLRSTGEPPPNPAQQGAAPEAAPKPAPKASPDGSSGEWKVIPGAKEL